MRVVAGDYRSRKLEAPEGDNSLRPTKDMVREAAFAMLGSRINLEGSVVLDLFSGSGSFGIEAISRGAEHVVFVDLKLEYTNKNIQKLNIESSKYVTYANDVTNFKPSRPADVVILDPPYNQGLAEKALANYKDFGRLGSLWLVETEKDLNLNFDEKVFKLVKQKNYGKSQLTLLKQST